ncbi:Flp family type IVb pilin [Nocardioides sp.]|uniref:Flp family type IVb pilin n=1 Tax=Nocardioides sp. TaxID=35761 RepID=UPI003D099076
MESNDVTARRRDERGASAVEYGLLIAGVAAVVVLVIFSFGHVIGDLFGNSCGTVAGTIKGTGC